MFKLNKSFSINLNKCCFRPVRRSLHEVKLPKYFEGLLNEVSKELEDIKSDRIYQKFTARAKAQDLTVFSDPFWPVYQQMVKKEEQLREEKLILLRQQLPQQQAVPMEVERSPLELFMKEFSEEIKEDFSVIDKLSNNAFNVVVDREVCLKQIANEMLRRSLLLLSGKIIDRRTVHRYIGIQAAPGGGKSQMLDYIGTLKGEIMDYVDGGAVYKDMCSELGHPIGELTSEVHAMLNDEIANLKKILNESLYIPITFNGETAIYDTDNIKQDISMRILYSYFIDKTISFTFDTFARKLRKLGDISIDSSLEMIRAHSKKKAVFLLFDEIGKVKSTDKVYECLRCVLAILNVAYNHVILTSLEVSNIKISATSSGRHIHFVHLNPLSIDSSLELFTDYTKYGYVKRMIVTLGGSPRCLELLSLTLKSNTEVLYAWKYETLFNILLSRVADRAIPYSRLTIEDVRPALLRTKIDMRKKLGDGRTYEESVERGIYLNSFTEKEMASGQFVPYISPFALTVFASKLLSEEKDSLLYQIGYTLYSLTSFLTLEEEELRGTPFEIAHGLWETLIRLLHQYGHPNKSFNLPLKSIYPSFFSSSTLNDVYFIVPGEYFKFVRTNKLFKKMNQDEFQPNEVYHYGGDNPGFDIACYPTAVDKNGRHLVAWNFEARFSTNDATTVESMPSILSKMELTLDQYKGSKYPANHVYLVFLLKRNVVKDLSNIPENCIVLKKEQLAACYGRSLSEYMFFLDE